MEFLQAETYGGIALFSFLKHFCIYKNASSPLTQQFYYCDNSTLIKQLQHDQSNKPVPNQTFLTDYNAHMTLWSTIEQILGDLSILHMKVHQD
eukprot:13503844-Ditylum_brightwellii.AAC.1